MQQFWLTHSRLCNVKQCDWRNTGRLFVEANIIQVCGDSHTKAYACIPPQAGRQAQQTVILWLNVDFLTHAPGFVSDWVGKKKKKESVPAYQNTTITVTKHNKQLKIINNVKLWWPCNHNDHWDAQIEKREAGRGTIVTSEFTQEWNFAEQSTYFHFQSHGRCRHASWGSFFFNKNKKS